VHQWAVIILLAAGVLHAPATLAANKLSHNVPADKRELLLLTKQSSTSGPPFQQRVSGTLTFQRAAPTFNFRLHARGLSRQRSYTLIYFHDTWPGDQLVCIASALSSRAGVLHVADRVDLNTSLPAPYDANGAQLQLVLTADVNCDTRIMVERNPDAYLFGKWPVRYMDTDITTGYSGTWCLQLNDDNESFILNMLLEQSGTAVSAEIDGFSFSGAIMERTMILTGMGPDEVVFTVGLTFSEDGETATGTLNSSVETFTATGTRGTCYDYEEPVGDPVCMLPVADQDLELVVGGQPFNAVSDGVVHEGLDFTFTSAPRLPTIVAPCPGILVGITRHRIALDNIIFSLEFRYNAQWSYLIALEPYSPDPDIADQQEAEIDVSIADVLSPGDTLGRLFIPVPDTGFPHIHWGLYRIADGERAAVCPRDHMTAASVLDLDELYINKLGLDPVCLPLPP